MVGVTECHRCGRMACQRGEVCDPWPPAPFGNSNYHPFDYTVKDSRADRGYWSTRPKDSDFHRDPPQPSDRWRGDNAKRAYPVHNVKPPLEVQSRMIQNWAESQLYPIIALAGDPESGKSTTSEFLSTLSPGFKVADTSEMLRRILVGVNPIIEVEGSICYDDEVDLNENRFSLADSAIQLKSLKVHYTGQNEPGTLRENVRTLMANTIRAIGDTIGYDKFFQACVKAAGVNLMPRPGVPLVIDSVRNTEQWQAAKQLYPAAKLWLIVKPRSPQHLYETRNTWPGNAADWLLVNDGDLATLKERILQGLDFGAAPQPAEWDMAGIVNQFYGRLEAVSKEK